MHVHTQHTHSLSEQIVTLEVRSNEHSDLHLWSSSWGKDGYNENGSGGPERSSMCDWGPWVISCTIDFHYEFEQRQAVRGSPSFLGYSHYWLTLLGLDPQSHFYHEYFFLLLCINHSYCAYSCKGNFLPNLRSVCNYLIPCAWKHESIKLLCEVLCAKHLDPKGPPFPQRHKPNY